MAVTQTTSRAGFFSREDVISSAADGDSGAITWAHGLGAAPNLVALTPLTAAGTLALYALTTRSSSQLAANKTSTQAGSGGANQLLVSSVLWHSIQQ